MSISTTSLEYKRNKFIVHCFPFLRCCAGQAGVPAWKGGSPLSARTYTKYTYI